MSGEKTYQPTARKLRKARQEGKTANSQILNQAIGLLAAAIGLWLAAEFSWVGNGLLVEWGDVTNRAYLLETTEDLLSVVITFSAPVLFAILALTLLSQLFTKGMRLVLAKLGFKIDNLNPVRAVSRVKTGLKRFWLRALLIAGIAIVGQRIMFQLLVKLPFGLADFLFQVKENFLGTLKDFCFWTVSVWCFCGLIDWLIARREFIKELMMTREEFEREHKDTEGDPRFKSARRARHNEILHADIVERVKKAKVIVVAR